MLKSVLLILVVLVVGLGVYFWKNSVVSIPIAENIFRQQPSDKTNSSEVKKDYPAVSVVAEGLKVPWALAFLPEGGMLVTERPGRVRLINKEGLLVAEPVATISVKQTAEGGLHGIALHPDFAKNKKVYMYYTYSESGNNTLNKVSRFTFENNKLINEEVIIDEIPGAANHDGGRIKFGPDGFLYITTGDAQNPSKSQDTDTLAGKILRVDDKGDDVSGNYFGKIYSYGHRNPQGITWDKEGNLWSTEHGPSGLESGNDELNKIEAGKNYGWPLIRGSESRIGFETPILESGKESTWAPAGIAYLNDQLFFAGLRGQALYRVRNLKSKPQLDELFKKEFGRLREVVTGPDGMLYVTTSNWDGRGIPKKGDDKILRINPNKL